MIPQGIVFVTHKRTQRTHVWRFQMHMMLVALQIAIGVVSFVAQIAFPITQFPMDQIHVTADDATASAKILATNEASIGNVFGMRHRVTPQHFVVLKFHAAVATNPRVRRADATVRPMTNASVFAVVWDAIGGGHVGCKWRVERDESAAGGSRGRR